MSARRIEPGSKEHFKRSCARKRRYADHITAITFAISNMEAFPGMKLDVYRCNFCSGWHLTKSRSAAAGHKLFRRQA